MGQDPFSSSRTPAQPRRSHLPELLIVLAVAALIPIWFLAPAPESHTPDAPEPISRSPAPTGDADLLAERSPPQPADQEVSFESDPGQAKTNSKPQTPTRVNARPRANSLPPERRDADPAWSKHSVAITEVYRPYVLSLRRSSDFNHDGSLDELDEELFSTHFENADPAADLNNDGQIDSADIIAFTQAREAHGAR